MPLEVLRFETYERLIGWIKKTCDAREAEAIANHERDHFDEAIRRGYRPVYAVQVLTSDGLIPFKYAVDFIGREPGPEDLIAICLAPANPSAQDLALVTKLRGQLRQ